MKDIKYDNKFLDKLEGVFVESDYMLRYEKGSFRSGYCVLKNSKVVVVNKFYSLEGKINCLVEILKDIDIDGGALSPNNQKFYSEITEK